MRIENLSVFGEYSQAENRVTAAFLQICKIGSEPLIRFFLNRVGIPLPSSEIEVSTQVKTSDSVPDGILSSNFRFNLYVESKVKPNSIDSSQLARHKSVLKSPTDFLLYITPDRDRPNKLLGTSWLSWSDAFRYLAEYLELSEVGTDQILEFLIQNFQTLLDNMGLLEVKWDLQNENTIVLAGSWAESVALRYQVYICQNKRSFRSAKYLSFYVNSSISHVFEILNEPEDDVDLRSAHGLGNYLQEQEPEYQGELKKLFRLGAGVAIQPIANDKRDKNGNLCPYTYGQPRYTTRPRLTTARFTSEL